MSGQTIAELAHRICFRYKHDTNGGETYTFNRDTLLQFVEVVQAQERERWAPYLRHGHRDGPMCERDKHSLFACTCGLDQLLKA